MAAHRSFKIQQLATTFEPPGMLAEQQLRLREPKRMLDPPKEPKMRQPKKIRSPRNQELKAKTTQPTVKDRSASIISKTEKVMEVAPNSPEYQIQFFKNSKKNTVESLPRLELRELLNSDEAQQVNQGRKKKKKKSRQKNEKAEKIEKTEKISEKTPSRDPEEEEDEDEEEIEEDDDEEGYSSGEEADPEMHQNGKTPIKKKVRIKKEKSLEKLEFENHELIRELKKKDEIIKIQEKSKEDMTTEIYELKLEIQRLKFKLRNVKVESKIKIARSSIRMDESSKNSLKEELRVGKRPSKPPVEKDKRNSRSQTQNLKRNSKKLENQQILTAENENETFVLRKKKSPRESDENRKKSLERPADHEKVKKSPRENEFHRSKSEPRENDDHRKISLEKALEKTLETEENRKNSLESALQKTLEPEKKRTTEIPENDERKKEEIEILEEIRSPGGSRIIVAATEGIEVENEKLKEEVLRLRSKNADSLGVIAEYEEIVRNQFEEIKELKGQLIKILELDESLQSQIAEERSAHLKTQEELNKLKSKYKVQDNEVSSPRKESTVHFPSSQTHNTSHYVSTAPYDHKKQLKMEKKKRRNFLRFGRSTSKIENAVHPREERLEIPQMNSLGSQAIALAAPAPPAKREVDAGPDSRIHNQFTTVDPQPIAMTPEQMRKELEVLVLLGEKLQDELTSEKKSHIQTKQRLEQLQGILEQLNHTITPNNSYEDNQIATPR